MLEYKYKYKYFSLLNKYKYKYKYRLLCTPLWRNIFPPLTQGTDKLPLRVTAALNMTRFKMVFTSFKTFPLVLEKRCEICKADGHVCVDDVYCPRCGSLSGLTKKRFTSLFDEKMDFLYMRNDLLNCHPLYVYFRAQAEWDQKIIFPSPLTTIHTFSKLRNIEGNRGVWLWLSTGCFDKDFTWLGGRHVVVDFLPDIFTIPWQTLAVLICYFKGKDILRVSFLHIVTSIFTIIYNALQHFYD